MSLGGKNRGGTSGAGSNFGSTKSGGFDPTSLDQTGKIIELADEGDDFSNLNSTGLLFDQLQRAVKTNILLDIGHPLHDAHFY